MFGPVLDKCQPSTGWHCPNGRRTFRTQYVRTLAAREKKSRPGRRPLGGAGALQQAPQGGHPRGASAGNGLERPVSLRQQPQGGRPGGASSGNGLERPGAEHHPVNRGSGNGAEGVATSLTLAAFGSQTRGSSRNRQHPSSSAVPRSGNVCGFARCSAPLLFTLFPKKI